MKNYIAKERVGIAADGVTLVAADDEKCVALFASEGSTVLEKKVAGKKNVAKFLKKDTGEDAEEIEGPAPAQHKRVAAKATPAHTPAPKVRE